MKKKNITIISIDGAGPTNELAQFLIKNKAELNKYFVFVEFIHLKPAELSYKNYGIYEYPALSVDGQWVCGVKKIAAFFIDYIKSSQVAPVEGEFDMREYNIATTCVKGTKGGMQFRSEPSEDDEYDRDKRSQVLMNRTLEMMKRREQSTKIGTPTENDMMQNQMGTRSQSASVTDEYDQEDADHAYETFLEKNKGIF